MTGLLDGKKLRIEWERDWDRRSLATDEAHDAVEHATEAAVAKAKTLAPVGQGDYRDSIEAIVQSVGGIWVGAIASSDFKAVWIERGAHSPTSTTPARHPLQGGAEAVGIRVTSGA